MLNVCKSGSCLKKVKAVGLCSMHYRQKQKNGKPSVLRTDKERFEGKFDRRNKKLCWLWKGSRGSNGYGKLAKGCLNETSAHRISYALYVSTIPVGLLICHKCDVKTCVNPSHLFAASHAWNMRDMRKKGRSAKGTRNGRCRVPWETVVEIRKATGSCRAVGRKYGVHHSYVSAIRKNEYRKTC